jgi:hypothetical protein
VFFLRRPDWPRRPPVGVRRLADPIRGRLLAVSTVSFGAAKMTDDKPQMKDWHLPRVVRSVICYLSFVILNVPIGLSHTYGGNYFSIAKAGLRCAEALR